MSATPIRKQYLGIKRQYPDVLVFFRLGDFYETFDEDARVVARELSITLTSREMGRGKRFPMAGVPHHALDGYLAKLVNRGYKVAICEQVGDASLARGLVDREVVRVVTPGTVVEPEILDHKKNNYLVSVVQDGPEAGIAYADISTGEFRVTQLPESALAPELDRLAPSELLLPEGPPPDSTWPAAPVTRAGYLADDADESERVLLEHFSVTSLESFGCEAMPLAIRAAGALVEYLRETQKAEANALSGPSTYSLDKKVVLDAQTRRNLELFSSAWRNEVEGSLLWVLDKTNTPMGARLLKEWIGQPLFDLAALERRLDSVQAFHSDGITRSRVTKLLSKVGDLERTSVRVQRGIANPKELVALKRGLELAPETKAAIEEAGLDNLSWVLDRMPDCSDIANLISDTLMDDPSTSVGGGGVVRAGYDAELDRMRSASSEARGFIANLEREERRKTGIKSLRVGYNKVFGYYVEVSRSQLSQVPDTYIRKQTLVNGERFVTPELKEFEALILGAQEKVEELEQAVYRRLCALVSQSVDRIHGLAECLALLDIFSCFAEVASLYGYIRPELTEDDVLHITAGRHPVVERVVGEGVFVPNDVHLTGSERQIMVLTGPNMAGKSTYMRQAALITLMAQIGSFVPAEKAQIGLVDRIFTRVGLQDDLSTGRSTFMIEMLETARILHMATPRSLIILDEIGRGTSTYDGLSIAQAVIEHLHNDPRIAARTIFATHYHELVKLADTLPRIVNSNVTVAEEDGKAVFLHKVEPGGADKSYGIHVAQLAGIPRPVIDRATRVLEHLENGAGSTENTVPPAGESGPWQMSFFSLPAESSPLLNELAELDVASMTPRDAILKLYELQDEARKGRPSQ